MERMTRGKKEHTESRKYVESRKHAGSGRSAANNNGRCIRELAVRSVKSSRMRNVFIVLTIVLSVSLLMVMALFYAGMHTATKRQVEGMQHVIYNGLSEEQLTAMAGADTDSTYVLGIKQGQGVEIDGTMVSPVAYEDAPLKDEDVHLKTVELTEGEMPESADEAVLADAYCRLAGVEAKPGEQVSVAWLDGTTETYTISGIYHAEEHQPYYNVILSETYAREGSQLKDIPWQAVVCLADAEKMTQDEFENVADTFGEKFGVARRNVNLNGTFQRSLPGGEQQMQEMLTIAGVGIGILLVSVLVIYSVFYLSVVGRIRQFGQLRTIGMTRKQIRKMVRTEGMLLSVRGIPIGLVIGGAVSYFIRPDGWSWINVLAISAVVTAADLVTVLLSIRRPAKIAASISPVEAVKYTGYEPGGLKKNKAGSRGEGAKGRRNAQSRRKKVRRITPSGLAFMSTSRNKKKTALTMASLGIGGVLYMLAAFWVSSTDQESYARTGEYSYGEFLITYSYNVVQTTEHGQTQLQAEHPMDENLIGAVREIDGVEQISTAETLSAAWESNGDNGTVSVRPFFREREESLREMNHEGEISYEDLEQNGGIICTDGDGVWRDVYGWDIQVGDVVTLTWYDGYEMQERTFEVKGVIDGHDYTGKLRDNSTSFILPDTVISDMVGGIDLTNTVVIKVDREKERQVENELNLMMEDYPYLSLGTLREEMLQVESMFNLLFSVLVGLSVFIIGFALINLINTLITNILTRDHEFAMLQSVGMTRKQLSGMLRMEALILAGGNLLITLVIGTSAGYVMIKILRYFGAAYMHFVFPGWFFAGYAVFIVLVPVLITEYMVRRFSRQTLVERLRGE
ncbi:MAG TPA: ABC transporter permease [Candidatus Mediterraneibacter vanvlietii]|nr:ABC transporter permease [Candidatus Mediterraneibacter vanvlietii]